MPCMRCFADARNIWYHTTKQKAVMILPLDGYRTWQETQEEVPRRSFFEFVHDFTKTESRKNHLFAASLQTKPKFLTTVCNTFGVELRPRKQAGFWFNENAHC